VPRSLFATTIESQATEITQLIFGSASKKWENLTETEKLDDLRRDAIRIFDALRGLDDRLAYLGQNLGRVERIALEAAKAVEELKAQQSKEGGDSGP
jgi:hypothetical protein